MNDMEDRNMDIVSRLANLVPPDQISTHPDQLAVVAHDESTLPEVTPLAVVWPDNSDQVVKIIRLF